MVAAYRRMSVGRGRDEALHTPRPTLREEQRRSTHERILEALAELLGEGQTTEVPMTAVAERAGIGERTLYRYFPTKLDLLQGLFSWMTHDHDAAPATDAAGLLERMQTYFRAYDANVELIRSLAAHASGGNPARTGRAQARRKAVTDAIGAEVAGLPEPRRTEVLAAVHLLTSSDAFLHARDFWGLDGDAVVSMSRWAVGALLAAVDAPASAPSPTTSPAPGTSTATTRPDRTGAAKARPVKAGKPKTAATKTAATKTAATKTGATKTGATKASAVKPNAAKRPAKGTS